MCHCSFELQKNEVKRLKRLGRAQNRTQRVGVQFRPRLERDTLEGQQRAMQPDPLASVEKMVGPAVKREGVAHLPAVMGLSEPRACSIVNADRQMIRYRSCRPPDTELRTHLRDLVHERKSFGYRRLFIQLRQDGEPSGITPSPGSAANRALWCASRGRGGATVGTRAPIVVDAATNACWSLDFVHDSSPAADDFASRTSSTT